MTRSDHAPKEPSWQDVSQLNLALDDALTTIKEMATALTFLAKGCSEEDGLDEYEAKCLSGALECLSLTAFRVHRDLHSATRTRS